MSWEQARGVLPSTGKVGVNLEEVSESIVLPLYCSICDCLKPHCLVASVLWKGQILLVGRWIDSKLELPLNLSEKYLPTIIMADR